MDLQFLFSFLNKILYFKKNLENYHILTSGNLKNKFYGEQKRELGSLDLEKRRFRGDLLKGDCSEVAIGLFFQITSYRIIES